jgi:hypothetical protein
MVDQGVSTIRQTTSTDNQTTSIGCQRTSIDNPVTSRRNQRVAMGNRATAVENQRTPIGNQGTAIRNQRTSINNQRTSISNQRTPIDNQPTPCRMCRHSSARRSGTSKSRGNKMSSTKDTSSKGRARFLVERFIHTSRGVGRFPNSGAWRRRRARNGGGLYESPTA